MTTGVWVLAGTVAVAVVLGVALRARSGQVRPAAPGAQRPDVGLEPFDGVTLLQLSTAFCAPCRHARALLAALAEREPGVRHVEVDLTERPELVERLGVRQAPTTLAIDRAGHELFRVTGVPRRDRLLAALRPYLVA